MLKPTFISNVEMIRVEFALLCWTLVPSFLLLIEGGYVVMMVMVKSVIL
jgi:hypothetical protein